MEPLDDDAADLDAFVVALLADPAMWDEPPSGIEDRLVDAIVAESGDAAPIAPVAAKRSNRFAPLLLGAAAAVFVMFVGVVAFSALSAPSETEALEVDLVPTGLIDDVEGTVELREVDSGLRIYLNASGLPRRQSGEYYEAWLRTADDRLVPCGTFHAGADVTLWAGADLDEVVTFSVTMEKAADAKGADQASSGDVVLKANLSGD